MPVRLNRSRPLLDANSVYHCQPTVSWCPESGQAIVVATHTTPRPVDHTNALDWRATAAAMVPKSPTMVATNTAESTRVGTAFGSAGSGGQSRHDDQQQRPPGSHRARPRPGQRTR
jgi:hypothetical protein